MKMLNRIVSYWNNIDNKLEVQMDVLDDFRSEAQVKYHTDLSEMS